MTAVCIFAVIVLAEEETKPPIRHSRRQAGIQTRR